MKKIVLLTMVLAFCVAGASFAQPPTYPKPDGKESGTSASALLKKGKNSNPASIFPKKIKGKEISRSVRKILEEGKKRQQPRQRPTGPSASQRADKPYQLIMVMNAANQTTWGAVDDNRKKLEEEIRKGTLARAALLYSREDGKTYIKMLLPEVTTFAADVNWSDEPEVPYIEVDTEGRKPGEILRDFLSSFENKDEYYTMVHVTFHGDGHTMISYIAKKLHILFPQFVEILASTKLKIDVLNLESCLMGTVDNMEMLFTGTSVKYLIAGSNVRIDLQGTSRRDEEGNRQRGSLGATPILDFFDKNPKDLVNAYVVQRGTKQVNNSMHSHNVMGVSSEQYKKAIHPLLVPWAKKVNGTYASAIQWQFTDDVFPATSFPSVLEQVEKLAADDREVKDQTAALQRAQFAPIMSYACWDHERREKVNDVRNTKSHPSCMSGFTADAFSLRVLAGDFPTTKDYAEGYNEYIKGVYEHAKEEKAKREEDVRKHMPKPGQKPSLPPSRVPHPAANPAAHPTKS